MNARQWHESLWYIPRWARNAYAMYKLAYEDNDLGMAYWKHCVRIEL